MVKEAPPIDFSKPDFESRQKTHDWKNYASEDLALIWDTFTEHQKTIIAASLQSAADREDWD